MASMNSTSNYSEQFSVQKRKHFGEKPYKCDMCNSAFSQNCNLAVHHQIHNEDKCETKAFKCHMCNAEFKHFGILRKHQRYHFAEKTSTCVVYVTNNFWIQCCLEKWIKLMKMESVETQVLLVLK